MADKAEISKLREALHAAALYYRGIDPKIGAAFSIGALYSFALPHIDNQNDLEPYNDLMFSLLQCAEGFPSELFTPKERDPKVRMPSLEIIHKAHAAAKMEQYMSDGVPEDEAADRVRRELGSRQRFDLTAKQIKELRRNINKGNYNKTLIQHFLDIVNKSKEQKKG